MPTTHRRAIVNLKSLGTLEKYVVSYLYLTRKAEEARLVTDLKKANSNTETPRLVIMSFAKLSTKV